MISARLSKGSSYLPLIIGSLLLIGFAITFIFIFRSRTKAPSQLASSGNISEQSTVKIGASSGQNNINPTTKIGAGRL